jgi:2-hydroxy-3-oxopropionate reductase
MQLGFVGLGVMGRPMALHLLRAGHQVAVWARGSASCRPLLEAGAVSCGSAAAVARRSQVVFTVITAGSDVEQVTFGADGLAEGFAAGSILVDMSTIAPEMAPVRWPGVWRCAGSRCSMLRFRAASRGPLRRHWRSWSVAGRLYLSGCGRSSNVLGRTIVHVGENGAGQVAKACNQMVMVGGDPGSRRSAALWRGPPVSTPEQGAARRLAAVRPGAGCSP